MSLFDGFTPRHWSALAVLMIAMLALVGVGGALVVAAVGVTTLQEVVFLSAWENAAQARKEGTT